MADGESTKQRVRRLSRHKGVQAAALVLVIGVIFAIQFLPSASHAEIRQELMEKYGIEELRWEGNGRYQADTLVIDGQDVTGECAVTGDWGPLDDLAIECEGDVSFTPVDQ